MPEISVIIPTFNSEKYLQRCFDSISKQTFSDIEIIFVDAESKDGTVELLKNFQEKDSRVKIIQQEDRKLGAARNEGVEVSSGEYISYIDSDDFISEDFLEGLLNSIKEYNSDISMSSVVRAKGDERRKLIEYKTSAPYEDNIEKSKISIGDGTGRVVWNKLYKKSFLIENNLKFRENVFCEDADYTAKAVYLAKRISTTDRGCYFYFVNKNSAMRKRADKKKQQDKYVGLKLTTLFEIEKGIIEQRTISKYDYNVFGLNLLRVKEKITKKEENIEYWLFDFIKIFSKKVK